MKKKIENPEWPNCIDCAFFNEGDYTCRRLAPKQTAITFDNENEANSIDHRPYILSFWAHVNSIDYCGEWLSMSGQTFQEYLQLIQLKK